MVLEVMCFSRANNEFARVIHRSVNRSLIDRIIRCGNASVRENTRNSARSFRVSPLCLQTSGFCPSLLGLHFSSHSLLVCPPVPSSRRFPTDLFLTLSFSFSSCFSFLSSRPRLPVERKKAAGLSVSFLPTIAHYRRDRWDLNPPAVVVVERTWTLHGMGTRARRRCSTRNETPYRWRLVQRSL